MKNIIIEVGSYDGLDGIKLSVCNPDAIIYSFEPNPELIKKIIITKKKIEKKLKLKLNNLFFIKKAASNFNGKNNFFVSSHPQSSSLYNFASYDDIKKYWKKTIKKYKWTKKDFYVKKKLVKVVTLEKFLKNKKFDNIIFFHCDAQGSDLKVFNSLGIFKTKLNQGVLEVANKTKKSLYKNNSNNLYNAKKILEKNLFKITKIVKNDQDSNELNIFFEKNNKFKRSLSIFNRLELTDKFFRGFLRRIRDDEINFLYYIIFKFLNFFNKINLKK